MRQLVKSYQLIKPVYASHTGEAHHVAVFFYFAPDLKIGASSRNSPSKQAWTSCAGHIFFPIKLTDMDENMVY